MPPCTLPRSAGPTRSPSSRGTEAGAEGVYIRNKSATGIPSGRYKGFPWSADRLVFSVREPYPSKTTSASLVFGAVERGETLTVVSQMPEEGVIFSDGIEADYLEFGSGFRAEIGLADKIGRLVI